MDYDKFERLLYANECAVRRRLAAPKERIALLDAVRELLAERDALIADNERLNNLYKQAVKSRADMRSALREARAAAPQPASSVALAQVIESGDYEARVQWLLNPLPVGSILYEEAPQPVGEVPMPDVHDYGYHDSDNGWVETLACDEGDVRTYGDAREAAGYARGLRDAIPTGHWVAPMEPTSEMKSAGLDILVGEDSLVLTWEEAAAIYREMRDAALRGKVKP